MPYWPHLFSQAAQWWHGPLPRLRARAGVAGGQMVVTLSPFCQAHNPIRIQRGRVMAINMFEGARRIAKLIAGFGVLWYCGYVLLDSPHVPIWYSVGWPGDTPILVRERTCPESKMEYRSYVPTSGGKRVSLDFCFIKQNASNGRKMVFYTRDDTAPDLSKLSIAELEELKEKLKSRSNSKDERRYLGNSDYSTEVTDYTKRTINAFVIPKADEDWIESQWWSARWKGIRDATLGLLGGLATLWAFTWATGWIVRGFMSIPRGSDSRE